MVLEALWLRTGHGVYANLFRYWLKIFAMVFGMGVVSGIVLSYQFGTNWSVFSDRAGPIIGPLMAYEILSAFFLEASFLGVMLFGINKVGRKLHFVATCMVALGTFISAFWIIAANSWMQTLAGYEVAAHEDDAERAVRAGLGLVSAVSNLKTHARLQTRVGIATGLVVVGDLIGAGASQEQAIVGETPNLAARLQGLAEPNSIVIADGT